MSLMFDGNGAGNSRRLGFDAAMHWFKVFYCRGGATPIRNQFLMLGAGQEIDRSNRLVKSIRKALENHYKVIQQPVDAFGFKTAAVINSADRSEEHTAELQS